MTSFITTRKADLLRQSAMKAECCSKVASNGTEDNLIIICAPIFIPLIKLIISNEIAIIIANTSGF